MTAFVALLRAVNVGGTGKLPMTELKAMCEELGFTGVRTYIASGNVVFASRKSETAVKAALENGVRCECARARGTCAEILRVEGSLWTFARASGVSPTNNAAERAERHAVIWRRISGGTDSAQGSRFVERILTVVATCRQQGRNVLDYLRSCFEAARSGQAIPSLLPVPPPKIEVA